MSSPHPTTGLALRVAGLSWRPLTRQEPTIDGLDLEIPAGQKVLLTGASGSGKSTVLRALAGLLDPEDGEGRGLPAPPSRPGERGLLLQNPAHALVAVSITRDVAFGPENAALPRPQIHERARAALAAARVQLDPRRAPLDSSGGQQQRIALAGSLALDPQVMLLDEPTSMLDAATAREVREAVLEAAEGSTLVLAEHRFADWVPHMDRMIVLGDRARILADGPPDQVLAEQRGLLEELGVLAADSGALDRTATAASTAQSHAEGTSQSTSTEVAALHQVTVPQRGLLTPVDLSVPAGSITALTGPSGAGKTTVLRTLLGEMSPGTGSAHRPPRERIAAVPQDPAHSFVASTVREELLASPWADDEQLAQHLLERAGLAHLQGAQPHRLSGGEQRRLAIAAALAQQPDLLVLDEPTVGLDAARRAEVAALLREAAAEGCAVLIATHDAEIIELADRHISLPAPAAEPPLTLPRPIPADHLNPLTLSLIGILALIGSFAVQTWQGGLLALAPTVLLAPLAVRTLRGGALRMLPVLLSAAGLAWTTALLGDAPSLSREAWLVGLKEAARITAFVAPGVLALGSVQPTPLGDAVAQHLRAPARVVAASVVALVRVSHLGRQWDILTATRVRRGLGTRRSPRLLASSTLALLIDTLRGAEQQALAMDSRGFATAQRRTWAEPSRFTRADLLGGAIAMLFLVWPLVAELVVG
ncbi:ATP-binding cassette domain-containing protein [Brachybacterium sp. Marseille-Q7125]|uniref:ATP-binding cassette domain-containing protein n=1 Tax=Brachybacterium sp. Marseille-Q7125 TaxID=2932815 RepID=UPI001FF3EBE5